MHECDTSDPLISEMGVGKVQERFVEHDMAKRYAECVCCKRVFRGRCYFPLRDGKCKHFKPSEI